MKKRLFALLMAAVMVTSLTACGEGGETPATVTATPTPGSVQVTATPTPEPTKAVVTTTDPTEFCVDFEDGKFGFVEVYENFATADASKLEIADFNNSKALKISKGNETKTPLVAIDVYSLLGDNAASVKSVEMQMGVSYADGTFNAVSGKLCYWTDSNVSKMESTDWSIFVESKNPKYAVSDVPEAVTLGADVPLVVIYFKEDLGSQNGHGTATLYVDNIRFLDASGKLVKPATTDVAFAAPAGFKNEAEDRSNLYTLANAVSLDGFNPKAGAWAQAGAEMSQEFIDALVPGSTIEFTYSSGDGKIWLVFPGATAGWSRIGDSNWAGNDHDEVFRNDSKNIAQVDYDQLVAIMGEDKSTWGTTIQCEGSSDWEVYSIKVGTPGNAKVFTSKETFDGFATSGNAWAQDGFDMPQNVLDALVPGSVLKLAYTSDTGILWVVFPDAAAGWSRVGDGTFAGNQHEAAECDGSVCYVTYEQIVALCGEDKAAWGARLQGESSGNWEIYSVEVGTFATPKTYEFKSTVAFEGFATSGNAWGQAGFDMPQEVLDALVPGSVIKVNYASDTDILWVVFPNATAGWSRVGDGTFAGNEHDAAQCDGSTCYVTYEQIVALCGEDKAAWGPQLQCESSGNWEVYSVEIGKLEEVDNRVFKKSAAFDGFATSGNAWGQNGFDIPQNVLDALVPGSVLKLAYTSDTGILWVVFPDAAAGWSRVGDGTFAGNQHDAAKCDGSTCYVTYEQIVELCGEDKAAWGARLQGESSGNWEIYSVEVGTLEEVTAPRLHKFTEFSGFATSAGAWSQNGFDMPQEIIDALVPGSVIKVNYSSETGILWVVFPGATAGWSRVGDGEFAGNKHDAAICDGSTCYVTYEQIVALCGEDKSTWGATLQCESSGAWEVFSLSIGQR